MKAIEGDGNIQSQTALQLRALNQLFAPKLLQQKGGLKDGGPHWTADSLQSQTQQQGIAVFPSNDTTFKASRCTSLHMESTPSTLNKIPLSLVNAQTSYGGVSSLVVDASQRNESHSVNKGLINHHTSPISYSSSSSGMFSQTSNLEVKDHHLRQSLPDTAAASVRSNSNTSATNSSDANISNVYYPARSIGDTTSDEVGVNFSKVSQFAALTVPKKFKGISVDIANGSSFYDGGGTSVVSSGFSDSAGVETSATVIPFQNISSPQLDDISCVDRVGGGAGPRVSYVTHSSGVGDQGSRSPRKSSTSLRVEPLSGITAALSKGMRGNSSATIAHSSRGPAGFNDFSLRLGPPHWVVSTEMPMSGVDDSSNLHSVNPYRHIQAMSSNQQLEDGIDVTGSFADKSGITGVGFSSKELIFSPSKAFRMLLYIDEPLRIFELEPEDLEFLLSNYGTLRLPVKLVPEKPAAEVTFSSLKALKQAQNDLNGLLLPGIGTLKCIALKGGGDAGHSLPSISSTADHIPVFTVTSEGPPGLPHPPFQYLHKLQLPGNLRGASEGIAGAASISSLPSLNTVNNFVSLLADETTATSGESDSSPPLIYNPQDQQSSAFRGNPSAAVVSAVSFPSTLGYARSKRYCHENLSTVAPFERQSSPSIGTSADLGVEASDNLKYLKNFSSSQERCLPERARRSRNFCRLELIDLFEYHPHFNVSKAILGVDNSNINHIIEATNDKVIVDITGKLQNSAPVADRLHVVISSSNPEAYMVAVEMSEDLLASVCQKFADYCAYYNYKIPVKAGFKRHEYEEDEETKQTTYKGCKDRFVHWWGNKVGVSKREKRLDRGRDGCRIERARSKDDDWTSVIDKKSGGRRGRGAGRVVKGNPTAERML